MKIALVPLNAHVGYIEKNLKSIVDSIEQAIACNCQLIIFPELSLIGYPPKDLLFYQQLRLQQNRALTKLKAKSKKITIIVGGISPVKNQAGKLKSLAFIIRNGEIKTYAKQLLPNYDVFDEQRYFESGNNTLTFKLGGLKFGISICEDIWFSLMHKTCGYKNDPCIAYRKLKLDYLINISASPFEAGKTNVRRQIITEAAQRTGTNVIYVNQLGANDDLVFDGGGFVASKNGSLHVVAPEFSPGIHYLELNALPPVLATSTLSSLHYLQAALILGIRDYVHKSGFSKAVLGLSGGVDSALVAYLAASALGPDNVLGVLLPSRFSSKGSITDAQLLAHNLGITTRLVPINGLHQAYEEVFKKLFQGKAADLTLQNIQARIRGNILMAIANQEGCLLLNTTNKSEIAVGYGTLYGDLAGALAVISDITKSQVYALCNFINKSHGYDIICNDILTKEPSAELKPHQKDSDSLPSYDLLDEVVDMFVDHHTIPHAPKEDFDLIRTLRMIQRSEFKRHQAPLGLKVTTKAFGSGRRIPIVGGIDFNNLRLT